MHVIVARSMNSCGNQIDDDSLKIHFIKFQIFVLKILSFHYYRHSL